MEKRRGKKEIEVTRRRRGGIRRGESKLASNHFLIYTPLSGLLRDVHGVIRRRGEGGRRQVARRVKEGNEKERDRSSQ